MRKVFILALAVICIVGLSAVSFAEITGSVHDLTVSTTGLGITEICAVCHSPHDSGANRASNGPLWNHEVSGVTFTLYSSDNPIAESNNVTDVSGSSRLCLGCHDGVTALDAYNGDPGTTPLATPGKIIPNLNGTTGDLSGTHPISVVYNEDPAYQLNPIGGVTLGGVSPLANVLVNTRVECSTCHDVHNNTGPGGETQGAMLLRADPTGSALCLACHNK